MAVRSANPRWLGLRLSMSGIGRMRPNSVRTLPSRRVCFKGLLDEGLHALVAREVAIDVGPGFGLRNAQLRGQTEGEMP